MKKYLLVLLLLCSTVFGSVTATPEELVVTLERNTLQDASIIIVSDVTARYTARLQHLDNYMGWIKLYPNMLDTIYANEELELFFEFHATMDPWVDSCFANLVFRLHCGMPPFVGVTVPITMYVVEPEAAPLSDC